MAEPADPLEQKATRPSDAPVAPPLEIAAGPPAGGQAPSPLLKNFRTTLLDEGGVLEESEPAPFKRRRGRPPKARARTVFDNRPITSAEMAFLRATVQGVSPHRAALTYLPGDVHQDGRAARPYLRQLLDRLHGGDLGFRAIRSGNTPVNPARCPRAPRS